MKWSKKVDSAGNEIIYIDTPFGEATINEFFGVWDWYCPNLGVSSRELTNKQGCKSQVEDVLRNQIKKALDFNYEDLSVDELTEEKPKGWIRSSYNAVHYLDTPYGMYSIASHSSNTSNDHWVVTLPCRRELEFSNKLDAVVAAKSDMDKKKEATKRFPL